jgi:demethylmenaquinone methyltransferase/2-methoxy-6-polyprenyl-1,4-benzoquinol methylase
MPYNVHQFILQSANGLEHSPAIADDQAVSILGKRGCRLSGVKRTMDSAIQDYFEAHAPEWDKRMPADYGALLYDFALPFADDFRAAESMIEIGTGTGAFIPVLRRLAPESRLLSIDLAFGMLIQAQQLIPNSPLLQASVHNLPLMSGCVDRVICHNSFPHFHDKTRALREIMRVMRPGGKILILHNRPREFVNAMHQAAGAPIDRDLLPTGDEMRLLLVDAGFSSVQVEDSSIRYVAQGTRS